MIKRHQNKDYALVTIKDGKHYYREIKNADRKKNEKPDEIRVSFIYEEDQTLLDKILRRTEKIDKVKIKTEVLKQ